MGKKKSKKGKKGDQSNPLLEDPLDVQENEERLLDDAAKSMVIKNPLLGTGDVWTEKKLQGLDAIAELEGSTEPGADGEDGGEVVADGEEGEQESGSFVLNPLAGLVGPDGQPTMVLVDENASNDDGKKKRRRKKGDDDSDSDDEDDGSKPWWQCWGAHDPWEDFSTEVQKLLTEPPKAAEKNPFKGEHKSELLYDMLVDATLKEKIKAQIKPMNARCQLAHEEIYDKVEVEEALRRTVAEGEAMYDMPPMRVQHFIRRIPSTGEMWDRFGVVIYMTNRHLFIFDSSTSKANRLERKPILGLFELQRYEIVHQRVDDMLMYPVPLNNIKGYSLDVSTESHAIATLDKIRNSNCLLLAIVMGALAALCFFVGQFESHPSLVVAKDGSSASDPTLEDHVTNFAADFIYFRWFTFAGAVGTIPYALFTLFERPALVLSPPQPFKSEDRKVLIGAREPMTKEHMVMELHLEDTYTTVDCKEFLRVMQLNSAHLCGGVTGEDVAQHEGLDD